MQSFASCSPTQNNSVTWFLICEQQNNNNNNFSLQFYAKKYFSCHRCLFIFHLADISFNGVYLFKFLSLLVVEWNEYLLDDQPTTTASYQQNQSVLSMFHNSKWFSKVFNTRFLKQSYYSEIFARLRLIFN